MRIFCDAKTPLLSLENQQNEKKILILMARLDSEENSLRESSLGRPIFRLRNPMCLSLITTKNK